MENKSERAKKILEELKEEKRKLKEKLKELVVKTNELRQSEEKLKELSKNLEDLEKIKRILDSRKSPWETKLALFNLVKDLRVEEIPLKNKKENYLLESCLLNHLAKECMKKYRKTTT